MNYCTRCESFYKTPGTCNCFVGHTFTPAQPNVVPLPWIGDPPPTNNPAWPSPSRIIVGLPGMTGIATAATGVVATVSNT